MASAKLTKSQGRQLKALDRKLKDLRVKAFIHAGSSKKTWAKIIADQDKIRKKISKLIVRSDLGYKESAVKRKK